jgi:hypothetical protein
MTDDATDPVAAAAARLGEALEYVERARGHLYEFHHLIGHADLMLDNVLTGLERAGWTDLAARVREELYGRDVLEGRWTYQVVDEFDDGYWQAWRTVTSEVRTAVPRGDRHTHEARMKMRRQQRAAS